MSTLIQLRTSFPPSPDGASKSLFASLPDFNVFGPLFDASFLVSAFISALVSVWTQGLKGWINDAGMSYHGDDDLNNRNDDWELVSVGRVIPR